jgi:hypothetical protein
VYKEPAGASGREDALRHARVRAANPDTRGILGWGVEEVRVGGIDVLGPLLVGGEEVGEDGGGSYRGSGHRGRICVLLVGPRH